MEGLFVFRMCCLQMSGPQYASSVNRLLRTTSRFAKMRSLGGIEFLFALNTWDLLKRTVYCNKPHKLITIFNFWFKDYYGILRVAEECNDKVLNEAYNKLAEEFQHDKATLAQIEEAYQVVLVSFSLWNPCLSVQ